MRQLFSYGGRCMMIVKTGALTLLKWITLDKLLNLCESQLPQESNTDHFFQCSIEDLM